MDEPLAHYLAPHALIYQDESVAEVAGRFGFSSFANLLQPWSGCVERVPIRLSNFESITAPSFPLHITDSSRINDGNGQSSFNIDTSKDSSPLHLDNWQNELTTLIQQKAVSGEWDHFLTISRQQDDSKTTSSSGKEQQVQQDRLKSTVNLDESYLDTPWYDIFNDKILASRRVCPQDSSAHPVCAILVVPTTHPDPMAAFASLNAITSPDKIFANKPYLDPNVLRYFVILHDDSHPSTIAPVELHEQVKRFYGIHSAILQLRSNVPLENNTLALKTFMRELVVQSIVPWTERSVQQLNDQISAARKGITGRLFSAGRKYFGGSGRSSPASTTSYNAAHGYYPYNTQEAQTRHLADLAFMIRDYRLAATMYDYARKDFLNEQVSSYYAWASRMVGICQIMLATQLQSSTPKESITYYEQALSRPGGPDPDKGSSTFDDLKAVLLYHQALKSAQDLRVIPSLFNRVAGQLETLSSALLLEQAAKANLTFARPARRRFAFQILMAAYRYESINLDLFAKRCRELADLVYSVNQLPLIHQSIDHGFARFNYFNNDLQSAVNRFLALLSYRNGTSGYPLDNQLDNENDHSFLSELSFAINKLAALDPEAAKNIQLCLPAALFQADQITFRSKETGQQSTTNKTKSSPQECLENTLQTKLRNKSGSQVKFPAPSSGYVEVTQDETFFMDISARNPLNTSIILSDINLSYESIDNNSLSKLIYTSPEQVYIDPLSTTLVSIECKSTGLGKFKIKDISYKLSNINCKPEPLETKTSKPIVIQSTSLRPRLSLVFTSFPNQLLSGELSEASLTLTNIGQDPLTNLYGICDHYDIVTFSNSPQESDPDSSKTMSNTLRTNQPVSLPIILENGSNVDSLKPLQSMNLKLLLRGDYTGRQDINFLFAYSSASDKDSFWTCSSSRSIEFSASLEYRPYVFFSSSSEHAYALDFEVYNPHPSYNFKIESISAISPTWAIKAKETLDDSKSSVVAILEPQQTTSLLFDIDAAAEKTPPTDEETFVANQLSELFKKQNVNAKEPEPISLCLSSTDTDNEALEKICKEMSFTRSFSRREHLLKNFPILSDSKSPSIQHIFPLFSSRSLDLIIHWSLKDNNSAENVTSDSATIDSEIERKKIIKGQSHLIDLKLGPGKNFIRDVVESAEMTSGGLYAESQLERQRLLDSLRKSDFWKDEENLSVTIDTVNKLEVLPRDQHGTKVAVKFVLRNLSSSTPSNYQLKLETRPIKRNQTTIPPEALLSAQNIPWVGALNFKGALEPLKSFTHTGYMYIVAPGVYDAGNVFLNNLPFPQTFIHVQQSS